jgi:hypothetical protein
VSKKVFKKVKDLWIIMDTYGYLWIPMDSYGVVAKLEASPIFDKSHGFNLSKGRGLGGRRFDNSQSSRSLQ